MKPPLALVLTGAAIVAGCGGHSTKSESHSAAGVRAMRTEILKLVKEDRWDSVCKDDITPKALREISAFGSCAAVLEEQQAKEHGNFGAPIASVQIIGNEARFIDSKAKVGRALYLGGRWRSDTLTRAEQTELKSELVQARTNPIRRHIAQLKSKLRSIEQESKPGNTAQAISREANLSSEINQLEAELEEAKH
jgi:hypothetical protein